MDIKCNSELHFRYKTKWRQFSLQIIYLCS
jgi:hypothetical protein